MTSKNEEPRGDLIAHMKELYLDEDGQPKADACNDAKLMLALGRFLEREAVQ